MVDLDKHTGNNALLPVCFWGIDENLYFITDCVADLTLETGCSKKHDQGWEVEERDPVKRTVSLYATAHLDAAIGR